MKTFDGKLTRGFLNHEMLSRTMERYFYPEKVFIDYVLDVCNVSGNMMTIVCRMPMCSPNGLHPLLTFCHNTKR